MEPKGAHLERSSHSARASASSSPSTSTSSSHHPSRPDEDANAAESPQASPSSPAKSPEDPVDRACSSTPSLEAPESASSPTTGSSKRSRGGGRSDREKRKRSRVTPDQLVHLERFFAMDRSPTAARRKEISELLGMQERQTQIWFQNRRAKAKLLDGKSKTRTDGTPPNTPPELQPGYEADLQSLLHESEPITIIPCYDLTIGTWRRIATQIAKHDLVTYLCEGRRCLVWFIHSSGYGFKMEIPFETVLEAEFTNASPGQGLATFRLSQPPQFFLEDVSSPDGTRQPVRTWKRCADWTEHAQASTVLRHDLVGAAAQLAHVLHNFQPSNSAEIRLHSPPTYHHPNANPAAAALPRIDVPDVRARTHPHAPTHHAQGFHAGGYGGGGGGGGAAPGAIDRRASYPGALLAPAPTDFRTLDIPPVSASAQSSPAPSPYGSYGMASPPGSASSYTSSYGGGTPFAGVDDYGVMRGYGTYRAAQQQQHQQHQQQQQQQQQGAGVGFPLTGASPAHGQYSLPATPSPPLNVNYQHQHHQRQQEPGAYQPSGMVGTLMPLPPPGMRYEHARDDARY